jgi:nickel-dependent lactate racemase
LRVPGNSIIYQSDYPPITDSPEALLLKSIENPVGSLPLAGQLKRRKPGDVVIVVSDFTRPIPYSLFLPRLIEEILSTGVKREEILILVATGMHRPSTDQEKLEMFGEHIAGHYRIVDHRAENEHELVTLPQKSWSGSKVQISKYYYEAGFRIITGLVEPHFMAGFSGGRKAICPGLVSLEAVTKFHGYEFLSHPNASTAILENNPCNMENISVARLCPADFNINIILDQNKRVNSIVSGDLFLSHESAVQYVKEKSCPPVHELADLAITSSGGYPLDNTFYQCVKGLVNCLPAIRENAEIHAFGNCAEGIGSEEYSTVMKRYSGRHRQFIEEIRNGTFFIKDQWQFQMHIRVLEKIGVEGLHFYTSGIVDEELKQLSVVPHFSDEEQMVLQLQQVIDKAEGEGRVIAVFPEGPYCSPTSK